MYQYMNLQSEDPNDDGRKRQSFFRRHWFFTLFFLTFLFMGISLLYLTEGRPIEKAKNFIDSLAGEEATEIAPAESAKSETELLRDDERALRPLINQYFEIGAAFKMHLYPAEETLVLKKQHPSLEENKGYFTRIEGAFFYVSNDGQRLYICEVDGELLADKEAREALEAAAMQAAQAVNSSAGGGDASGIVIYSPSTLSGESLDHLTRDPSMKGIFRDADGTWRNY